MQVLDSLGQELVYDDVVLCIYKGRVVLARLEAIKDQCKEFHPWDGVNFKHIKEQNFFNQTVHLILSTPDEQVFVLKVAERIVDSTVPGQPRPSRDSAVTCTKMIKANDEVVRTWLHG